MIKDILVYLDNKQDDAARLAVAEALAVRHDAHLTGLYCNYLPEMMVTGDAGMVATQVAVDMQDEAMVAGDKGEKALRPVMDKVAVRHDMRRIDAYPGQAAAMLAVEARTSDVFVGSLPGSGEGRHPDIVERVMFDSGRACLLVPEGGTKVREFGHVMIAWRNQREAARAVSEAMPVLKAADKVSMVMVTEGGAPEEEGTLPGANMARHLDRHGVRADLKHVSGWDDVAAAVLNEAQHGGADLLVMGGYGHSRFREWILGGVTRDVLFKANLPVFMAH